MRVKKRIHPLDLCVILLIILCLLGLFLRWKDLSARDTDGAVRYEIVMEMPGVRWETAACYDPGETLYTEVGEVFGSIRRIERQPHKIRVPSEHGTLFGDWGEEKVDLRFYVEAEGAESNGRFLWDGRHALLCGERYTLYTKRARLVGTVLHFEPQIG
ncbi:MAG: DUF4330 family protein [Clostridia bacterium]|nr:DUF4330 family protein [Clostridia bacterium]